MKLNLKPVCLTALIIVFAAPSFAAPAQPVKKVEPAAVSAETDSAPEKIGVVDVKKVVSSSKAVAKVKKEQAANKKALVAYIKSSADKINKEKDEAKKEELKKAFSAELQTKREAMNKTYTEKLMKINNDMNTQLTKIAKEKKYDLILTQDSVLYGGEDLTKDLMRLVK